MIGVEILTSAQVVAETAFNWNAFWITFGIICGIFTILGIVLVITNDQDWTTILLSLLLGAALGTAIGGSQYEVTISDEVSATKFLEHYEVVDQNGRIFTVREKKDESN